jgi:GNAT superfamily N-acetyltransferase
LSLAIRPARPDDSALIFALVRELAVYEKMLDEVDATEEMIAGALFCAEPRLYCDIAEWGGAPAGFALWFLNFSTFRGRHGIYLEDLFVRPAYRGRGIGMALMRQLARRCLERGYARCEWAVLDWNAPSIAFYKSIGALTMERWKICRLSGEPLAALARQETVL